MKQTTVDSRRSAEMPARKGDSCHVKGISLRSVPLIGNAYDWKCYPVQIDDTYR